MEIALPAERMLEEVGYEDICDRVDIADLAGATGDAIAQIAPATAHHPDPPADLSGILGPETQAGRLAGKASDPATWWTTPFQSPALYAASLHDVLCFGGLHHDRSREGHTLLVRDRLIVPDSYFVRNAIRSLPENPIAIDGAGIATRPGLHYFAGAAWEQFGHFLLEGLSRWWLLACLPEAVRAELHFVLYNDRPLRPWQLELLAGLGIGADRLVYLTEPTRFERLIVPSIAYNLHRAAAHAQRDTWERIARAFDNGEGPARVYLSRSRYPHNRVLLNETEVERRFQERGFTILHPQELSIPEQLASIRHARLIAGSAGSAMYLSAFANQGARKLIVSPRSFTFRDDQLIAHLRGERLAYVLCAQEAVHEHPRMADYRVALETLEDAIERWSDDQE